ncbi:MAG: hypothetical protein DHS20C18_51670 [Saprospiraceae bacterium]|nr:MAG: hypothetical protein DHS20C18_51670 [Saprospiraceae bacterium]
MNRSSLPIREKIKYLLLSLTLIGLVVLYVLEFNFFHLTFNLPGLIIKGLIVGLVLGIGLAIYYQKQASDLTERVQLYVFFIVLCMIFMPLVVSLSNRLLNFAEPVMLQAEYVDIEPYYSDRFGLTKGEKIKPSGYFLFFYYNNRLKRIRLENPPFQDYARGATIVLPVKKGLWGHAVVIASRIGEKGI